MTEDEKNRTDKARYVEFGLIAAGISVAIIAIVQGLGLKLAATWHFLTGM